VPSAVGISWYKRDNYNRCLSIFDDASVMPDSFEEWLARAENVERQMNAEGLKVVRVYIDPDKFPVWCAENGYDRIDVHARRAYGNLTTLRMLKEGN
jgi:hypothetical protein